MLHRAIQDPVPPPDADVETAAMAETAVSIERGERHLALLSELAEISMSLVRTLGDLAQKRAEAEMKGEAAKGRPEDAAAALGKMAQTVRRTVALEARLAADLKAQREGLVTQRAERRAARTTSHEDAVKDAIAKGLHDAWAADSPDDEYHGLADRMLDEAREYLIDADEMRGWLDRPVGETVARLCARMGLDPGACEHDGEGWRVRRPPLDFELRLAERESKYSFLPRIGEGQGTKHPGWGNQLDPPPLPDFPDPEVSPPFIDTSPP